MLNVICLGLAVLLGLALAANGIFMLVSPEHWYVLVPGVTSTGPFNQHFLRDIGLIFVFLGGAFLVGAARPQVRILLWGAGAIWLLGHALFHFWEVAVGILLALRPGARLSGGHASGHHRERAHPLGNMVCGRREEPHPRCRMIRAFTILALMLRTLMACEPTPART